MILSYFLRTGDTITEVHLAPCLIALCSVEVRGYVVLCSEAYHALVVATGSHSQIETKVDIYF